MNVQKRLQEWHKHNIIDNATRAAIEDYEATRPRLHDLLWRYGLVGLAVLCVSLGLLFIVAANWQDIPFSVKIGTHAALNLALAGWLIHHFLSQSDISSQSWKGEIPLIFLTAGQLSFMAMIGQYLQSNAPVEDVMLYWWILVAPMLLLAGRARFSALILILLSIYLVFAKLDIRLESHLYIMIPSATALFIAGTTYSIEKRRPSWAGIIRTLAISVILVLTLCSMHMRDIVSYGYGLTAWYVFYSAGVAFLCAAFTCEITRKKEQTLIDTTTYRAEYHVIALSCLIIIITLSSGLVTSAFYGNTFLNMILFSGYCLGIARIGYHNGKTSWISLSIGATAIRMIIYFVGISNNMLTSGLAMIVIGLAALAIIKKLYNTTQGNAA